MTSSARPWDLPHDAAVQEIAQRVVQCGRRRISGTLHRATYDKYLHPSDGSAPAPLYFAGSLSGRRYTPRGGPAGLYLSFDPLTPLAELRLVELHPDRVDVMPATQLLAVVAHLTCEFVGIKYNSVRTSLGTNMVVFRDRLVADDRLEVVDSTGRLVQRLGAAPPEVAATPVE